MNPLIKYSSKITELQKFYFSITRNSDAHVEFSHRSDLVFEKWEELQEILIEPFVAISPNIWRGGHPLKENFIVSYFVALDFDCGKPNLINAQKIFSEFDVMIYTTKSHSIEKNGEPPCDRFRVFLKTNEKMNAKECRETNERLLYLFPTACSGQPWSTQRWKGNPTAQFFFTQGNLQIDIKKLATFELETKRIANKDWSSQ